MTAEDAKRRLISEGHDEWDIDAVQLEVSPTDYELVKERVLQIELRRRGPGDGLDSDDGPTFTRDR
jgi:hypothetical protein